METIQPINPLMIERAKSLGIEIQDNRGIDCGITVVNNDVFGCTLAYSINNKFCVNTTGKYYHDQTEIDRLIKKLADLNELMFQLNCCV